MDSQLQNLPGIMMRLRSYPRQSEYVSKNSPFLALHIHIKAWEEMVYAYGERTLEWWTPNISEISLRALVTNQDSRVRPPEAPLP